MSAKIPGDLDRLFAEAAARGDADAIAALYEPDAVKLGRDGVPATGTAAIRDSVAGMASMKPHITMNVVKTVIAGDIAIVYNDWSSAGPDGKSVAASGHALEVCRRQPDGSWLFVIDDPTARN